MGKDKEAPLNPDRKLALLEYLEDNQSLTYARGVELFQEIDRLESELMAVMQLGVDKWLEGPDLELNNATRAGRAREIALQAIEKSNKLLEECVKALKPLVQGKEHDPNCGFVEDGMDCSCGVGTGEDVLVRARAFLKGN